MTVLTFPSPQRPSVFEPDASRTAETRAAEARAAEARANEERAGAVWCDERAQLRLIADLQRSLIEGLLAVSPAARAILHGLR